MAKSGGVRPYDDAIAGAPDDFGPSIQGSAHVYSGKGGSTTVFDRVVPEAPAPSESSSAPVEVTPGTQAAPVEVKPQPQAAPAEAKPKTPPAPAAESQPPPGSP